MSGPGRAAVQGRLGYRFRDEALLEEALTHASWRNENPSSGGQDNERLEWLGDAVLGLAVTQLCFDRDLQATEGELTKARAEFVNDKSLARLAADVGLGEDGVLRLGVGERQNGDGASKRLAGAFEALVGAVFLDCGSFEQTVDVVRRVLDAHPPARP